MEAPPGFEPRMEFCRQGWDVYLVGSSCSLVSPAPAFSLVFGRYCSQIVPTVCEDATSLKCSLTVVTRGLPTMSTTAGAVVNSFR